MAVDGAGDSFIADLVNNRIREVGAPALPGAPTNVTAAPFGGKAKVSWTAPAYDGGSPITTYQVAAQPGGLGCTSASSTSCVVEGLSDGISYTFTVTATNSIGTSAASAQSLPMVAATLDGIYVSVNDPDSGSPLANVCANLWDGSAELRTSCSDAEGNISMDHVAQGTYTLQFVDSAAMRQTTWWGGAADQGSSTPVVIDGSGNVTGTVDMTEPADAVTGTVDFPAGDPTRHMCAYLYHFQGAYAGIGTCTNASGVFSLPGYTPGDYDIAFVDPAGLIPTQWLSGSGLLTKRAAATVALHLSAAGLKNLSVGPKLGSNELAGQISDGTTGNGLANECLYAYIWDTATSTLASSAINATCTNANGGYAYFVNTNKPIQLAVVDPTGAHPVAWIDFSSDTGDGATAVAARPSNATALSPSGRQDGTWATVGVPVSGSISGTITNTSAQPVPGACAYAYYADDGVYIGGSATADSSGHYLITGLAPGGAGYTIAFAPSCASGQLPSIWNGGATSQATAPPVTITAGQETTDIDATL